MARLSSTSPFHGLQGQFGKEIVFKKYGDKTIVSKYPDMSKVKPTARQQEQRTLFKEAMLFARLINQHAELRGFYQALLLPGETVFHKAKKEYLMRLAEQ